MDFNLIVEVTSSFEDDDEEDEEEEELEQVADVIDQSEELNESFEEPATSDLLVYMENKISSHSLKLLKFTSQELSHKCYNLKSTTCNLLFDC